MITGRYNKNTDIIEIPFIGALLLQLRLILYFVLIRIIWNILCDSRENFRDKIQFSRNVIIMVLVQYIYIYQKYFRVCVSELRLIRVMNGCNNAVEDWWLCFQHDKKIEFWFLLGPGYVPFKYSLISNDIMLCVIMQNY